ncbi:hypothetical protein CALCODRAFT_47638 [Calocera cornea HHB12733]|uniref:Uncharacterized protein n=1 Tax=Calocera cornea HHB12733 TaxID=1353952 RepID=A0A165DUY9_9BASI|nr:hypothetical protein CALCODRAFT_47638 [Calocera cornea HHB12733]
MTGHRGQKYPEPNRPSLLRHPAPPISPFLGGSLASQPFLPSPRFIPDIRPFPPQHPLHLRFPAFSHPATCSIPQSPAWYLDISELTPILPAVSLTIRLLPSPSLLVNSLPIPQLSSFSRRSLRLPVCSR